jgi:hypothetical protein
VPKGVDRLSPNEIGRNSCRRERHNHWKLLIAPLSKTDVVLMFDIVVIVIVVIVVFVVVVIVVVVVVVVVAIAIAIAAIAASSLSVHF